MSDLNDDPNAPLFTYMTKFQYKNSQKQYQPIILSMITHFYLFSYT